MMSRSLTRWTLSLFLLTSTAFSSGCVHPPINPPVDTSWVKPIYFHDATLKWLDAIPDWPETAYEDFDAIAKHNAKYEQIHNVTRPPLPTTNPK